MDSNLRHATRTLVAALLLGLAIPTLGACDYLQDQIRKKGDALKNRGQKKLWKKRQAQEAAARIPPRGKKVLLVYDFEAQSLAGWNKIKLPTKDALEFVTAPVRGGRYAARFQLRKKDKIVASGKRAEIERLGVASHGETYWYGFSIFVPADWQPDHLDEVVAQWNATADIDQGENERRSPPLAIRIEGSNWRITNRWDEREITPPGNEAPQKTLWVGGLDKGRWVDWVVNARWSYGPDGLVQVWKDGKRVVRKEGMNTYRDRLGLRFKVGIYKPVWNDPDGSASRVSERTVYHDEIRIAGDAARYEDVAPGGASPLD